MAYSVVKAMAVGTLFLALAVQAAKEEVTPIQKVVELLGGLSGKIAAEGKDEAAQYDKFSCFCKEQANAKHVAIEKNVKILAMNAALQERLGTEIGGLSNQISTLTGEISDEERGLTTKTADRGRDHKAYLKEAFEVAQAVNDCEAAIAKIEEHLAKQKRDTRQMITQNGGASLLQIKLEKHTAAATVLALLADEEKKPQLGYDATYQIIVSMKKFADDFKKQAAQIDLDEGKAKHLSDAAILGHQSAITLETKDEHEIQELSNRDQSDKEAAAEASSQATKDKTADELFLAELTSQCESKATLFDQRSQKRSAEQTALALAIDKLKTGTALSQVSALALHKRVSALAKNKGVVKRHIAAPTSLLQISRQVGQAAAVKKARSFLGEAVARSESVALSSLAVRMQVAGDHFVKVRKLVTDMIAKLQADAAADATKKGFCDKGIKEGTEDRDEAQVEIEDANSQVAKKTAEVEMKKVEVATTTAELSALKKALSEATELRASEKKNNEETIKVATESLEAVDTALRVLDAFYNNGNGGFLQYSQPANADSEGKTVGDRAPEVFAGEYEGAQDDAKGILGMLEVCKSDFEHVKEETETAEENSADEHEDFVKETDESVEEKEELKEDREGEIKELKADIVLGEEDLEKAKTRSGGATTALEKMRELCDLDGEPAGDRQKSRLAEIDSLKEAMDILDNWKNTAD